MHRVAANSLRTNWVMQCDKPTKKGATKWPMRQFACPSCIEFIKLGALQALSSGEKKWRCGLILNFRRFCISQAGRSCILHLINAKQQDHEIYSTLQKNDLHKILSKYSPLRFSHDHLDRMNFSWAKILQHAFCYSRIKLDIDVTWNENMFTLYIHIHSRKHGDSNCQAWMVIYFILFFSFSFNQRFTMGYNSCECVPGNIGYNKKLEI